MKKLIALLAVAFLIISATIIFLIKNGVSIRSAPIIRPSPITRDGMNIAQGVALRLAPEFQNSHYVIWGVLPASQETQKILQWIQEEHEKLQSQKVSLVLEAQNASSEQIESCQRPCWLFVPQNEAHEMDSNAFIEKKIRPLNRTYTTITYIPFSSIPQVPETCENQKRLSYECLKVLAVHEAKRKMKLENERYFFMKKHLDRDYFLFVQDAPSQN